MPEPGFTNSGDLNGATVVEMVSSVAYESFGLGYAALNLAAALERAGTDVYLVCVDQEEKAYEACEETRFPRERLIRGSWLGPSRLRYSPLLHRRLRDLRANGRGIIHMHGLWTYVSRLAGWLRKDWNCPLVMSTHGEVDAFALAISRRKKALASLLYERRNLMTASCMWALSEQETLSIRAYGYPGPIAVIPNGVSRAIECSEDEIEQFRVKHEIPSHAKLLLFLARIAPQKNLPLLLKTFARAVRRHPEWILTIAGNDERNHINVIRALIRELGIERIVRFIGPVSGKQKALAFSSASLYALPSISEGLPISVLEAMEYGKPVLATDVWTLPWANFCEFGWRVPPDEYAFETSLDEALSTSVSTLREKGMKARAIVRAHFDWDAVAQRARALYGSLLTAGEHPAALNQISGPRPLRVADAIQLNTILNDHLERQ